MNKVMILGAGSCFGTHLAGTLLEHGYRVCGIGRSPKKPDCFSLGIDYPYFAYHITYEHEYVLEKIARFEPDYIVSFAAQGEGAASWDADNWRFYETNCVGLVRLVGILNQRRNFGRFIQIGTSELYGSRSDAATEEAPVTPTSPYGISKAAFDLHLKAMWERQQFPMNILRPSNAYGEGQQLHRVIPKAMIYGLTNRKLQLHGGGVSRKSYLHAQDVSLGIMHLFNAPLGEIYNCAPDEPTSIKDVVTMCAQTLKIPFSQMCELAPERFGQDDTYWMNADKLKALGWKQTVDWHDGLERMFQWVKKYPELLRLPTDFTMRA